MRTSYRHASARMAGMSIIGALALALAFGGCSRPAADGASSPNGGAPAAQSGPGGAQTGGEAGGGAGQRRQGSVTVQVTAAVEGALAADRKAAAAVSTTTQSQVAALVSGVVRSVAHRPGDWVREGEAVVQLDEAQLRIALSNAQASLEAAKINLAAVQDSTTQNNAKLSLQVQSAQAACDAAQKYYDAQKALFDLGGISGSALDTANAQLASAKAALETAKIALDQNQRGVATTASQNVDTLRIAVATAENNLEQAQLNLRNAAIRAPFGGQISAINVAPGMYVGLNTAVFVLVSSERQVSFGISPQDAPALPAGAVLRFDYAGSSIPLSVRQAPSAPVNGVVPMVAGGSGLASLPFGVVGEVVYRVILARGVIVPMSAIDTADNRNVVYVVEDGKVAIWPVEVVAESGAAAAVTGLGRGSLVIVSPPPGLVPGAQVRTVPATDIDLGPGIKTGSPAPAGAGAGGALQGEGYGSMSGSSGQGARSGGAGPAGQGSTQAQAGRP